MSENLEIVFDDDVTPVATNNTEIPSVVPFSTGDSEDVQYEIQSPNGLTEVFQAGNEIEDTRTHGNEPPEIEEIAEDVIRRTRDQLRMVRRFMSIQKRQVMLQEGRVARTKKRRKTAKMAKASRKRNR